MNNLRFGIVGCGRVAPKHFHALKEIEGAELVAVCDTKENIAKEAAEKNNCKHYTDYSEMLNDENINIVTICTPSGLHAEMAAEAAKHKKHVITEKPMALSIKDADMMIKECKDNDVCLFVVKQNRYNPPVKELRRAFEKGRFGKLVLINTTVRWSRPQEYYDQDEWRGTWKMDGGVLMNQASHHVDLVRWFGGEVDSVFAKTATVTHDIEVEDTAAAVIKFKNGTLGVIEATTCVYPKNLEGSLTVIGEKGVVKIGGFAVNKMDTWEFKDYQTEDDVSRSKSTNPPDVYGFGHIEFYKKVVDVMKNNGCAAIDGEEGKKSLQLIEAIYESEKTGKEIKL